MEVSIPVLLDWEMKSEIAFFYAFAFSYQFENKN